MAVAASFLPLLAGLAGDAAIAGHARVVEAALAAGFAAQSGTTGEVGTLEQADPAEPTTDAEASQEPEIEVTETDTELRETVDPLADDEIIQADESLIEGRKRPGQQRELPDRVTQDNVAAVRPPPPEAFPTDEFPVPDRWRIAKTLCVDKTRFANIRPICNSSLDPYNQNFYKGDIPIPIAKDERPGFLKWLPIKEEDWFFIGNAISDTIVEPRTFPIPVGVQTTEDPDRNDVFGENESLVVAQTFIVSASLVKGSTAYKPPDVEYRVALAYQVNHVEVPERRVLFVEPSKGTVRTDHFLGVQELFVDYHLKNTSDRYDFQSVRVGIQPFNADFRGFLFQDNQLGFRFFGNRDNNRFQYNLAAFWRLEKDTNSGLNDVTQTPRDDYILFANVFRQDFPTTGFTSQASLTLNINREAGDLKIDDNGFPVRPALLGDLRGREYEVVYLGYSGDGRIGRINWTHSLYAALGEDRNNFFTSRPAEIRAYFGAAEASYDTNFARLRVSGLFASGDGKPYNNVEAGFDSIFENPIFAGADTSYWIRQTIPFAGGGRVIGLNGRNGLLNSLRSSKEQGQSNFNNPGTILVGAGADFDITPTFRLSANANHLWFHKTQTLEALRTEGSIPRDIGFDLSAAAIYRPQANQNLVFRLSGAVLEPGKGLKDLFANLRRDNRYYSVLFNAILSF